MSFRRTDRGRVAVLLMFAAMAIGIPAIADAQSGNSGKGAVMLTEPRLEQRAQQPYVGIRSSITMSQIGTVLPPLIGELFAWLGQRQATPVGPPFFRYRVIDMSGHLEIDVGVPVAAVLSGDQRVIVDTLPAGAYATAIYTGNPAQLADANAALQKWGSGNGIKWRAVQLDRGTEWASRLEIYLTDPAKQPDPSKWQTEIAYLTEGGK
jgi:effector-binding domain-containing protein